MLVLTHSFFVVAFAVAFAYSLLALLVRPGSAASRLLLLSDVVIIYITLQMMHACDVTRSDPPFSNSNAAYDI